MLSVETWDIAGYPCFGLRCEVEDAITNNPYPLLRQERSRSQT